MRIDEHGRVYIGNLCSTVLSIHLYNKTKLCINQVIKEKNERIFEFEKDNV